MKIPFKKILNIKEDFIEIIPGDIFPDKEKLSLESFLDKIKANKGEMKSINVISRIDTKWDHYDRFVPEAKEFDPNHTGYIDDVREYQEQSRQFIIHYRCYKKLTHD